jgi:hypothetical protein
MDKKKQHLTMDKKKEKGKKRDRSESPSPAQGRRPKQPKKTTKKGDSDEVKRLKALRTLSISTKAGLNLQARLPSSNKHGLAIREGKKELNLSSKFVAEAAMGQMIGDLTEQQCEKCSKGHGYFLECRTVKASDDDDETQLMWDGSCMNCHLMAKDTSCSIRGKSKFESLLFRSRLFDLEFYISNSKYYLLKL